MQGQCCTVRRWQQQPSSGLAAALLCYGRADNILSAVAALTMHSVNGRAPPYTTSYGRKSKYTSFRNGTSNHHQVGSSRVPDCGDTFYIIYITEMRAC